MSRADLVARLDQVDAALVAAGFPALSPFWRETFRAFLSGRKRSLVVRAGRRGGKSSSCARLAVVVALFGEHVIPPGDLGIVAFISASRDEAANRLRMIKAILDALRVKYTERGDTIELAHRPIAFQVFTASIAGVSGPTCICVFADEVAKWRDRDTGANPAKEVLASVRATMATQPMAFMVLLSSPWSTLDAHHDAFARGDTEDQSVAFAPTWIANPTIAEEETHRLEPDHATWSREYAAEPMGANGALFFDHDALDNAIDASLYLPLPPVRGRSAWAGLDPAFKSDAAALAVITLADAGYVLSALEERVPTKGNPLSPAAVISDFVDVAQPYGCTAFMSDGHYIESVRDTARARCMTVDEIPGGIDGKSRVYTKVRELLNTGRLVFPANAGSLVRALKETAAKPTASGSLSITHPRRPGNHGDTASAYVAAIWAATDGFAVRFSDIDQAPTDYHFGDDGDRWAGMSSRGF